jgi:hypothetical protein
VDITNFLTSAVTQLQQWLGLAAVVFLLFSAVQLLTAGDNPMQRSQAWHRLLMVGAALVLIIFAKTLITTIYGWAGVPSPF